ncbi:MAG: hypothetical protein PHW52_03590, partial [Candidatus Pacebacteria bacterium]|nr:hypothetical protein [Candidatus Paceibacterota bacterium]
IITATLTDSNTPTPHSVTGTATAGAGGAYTVVLNGTSLNDGNISVSVYASDAAGNDSAAVTTPSATKDIVVPTISTNQTQDLDGDGKIDALKITFNKNIVDSTVNPADFDVSGYTGEAFSSTTNGDIANNNVIYITFTEGGAYDTGNIPSLAYAQGTLADNYGNLLASAPTTASTDKALPVVTKLGNDSADVTIAAGSTATLTFSEALSAAGKTAVETALTNGADKAITFIWNGGNNILTINGNATAITTFETDAMASVADTAGNSASLLLIDSSITSSQAQTNNGNITLDNTTPEGVIVDPVLPIVATIAAGTTNPEINVDSFIDNGTGVLPAISIVSNNAGNVNVDIPANTTVTSADTTWNGVIAAPTNTTVTIPGGTTDTAIQIGFTGAKLSFDNAVRILIPGGAGKRVGYVRTGITFTEITATCAADSQATGNALVADGDCKIAVGSDMVIWTKHFTTFATYTTTVSGGGSGGGGGSGSPSNPFITSGLSISINNGDSRTLTNQVTLTLNGGVNARKMVVSNDDNFIGAVQEAYSTTKQWNLSSGEGMKKVCVRFYDANGYYSDAVCDQIAYGQNTIVPTLSRQEIIRKIIIMIIQRKLASLSLR